MCDERRMTRRDAGAQSVAVLQLGNCFGHAHANANPLIVGQRHDAADAAMASLAHQWKDRAERNGFAVPKSDVALGGRVEAAA
jgi:hypothetical protein